MAEILDAGGRRGEARTVLQEWLESHPDSTDARMTLARLAPDVGTREIRAPLSRAQAGSLPCLCALSG